MLMKKIASIFIGKYMSMILFNFQYIFINITDVITNKSKDRSFQSFYLA